MNHISLVTNLDDASKGRNSTQDSDKREGITDDRGACYNHGIQTDVHYSNVRESELVVDCIVDTIG
jgi:hypothetical protein